MGILLALITMSHHVVLFPRYMASQLQYQHRIQEKGSDPSIESNPTVSDDSDLGVLGAHSLSLEFKSI